MFLEFSLAQKRLCVMKRKVETAFKEGLALTTSRMQSLMIGWVTVRNATEAETLAEHLVEKQLAAGVQIEGPIRSHYRWAGEIRRHSEYRLKVIFPAAHETAIVEWLQAHHPYEVPQWLAIEASTTSDYLNWAIETTSGSSF